MGVGNAVQDSIESLKKDFKQTPTGQHSRWKTELDAADKAHKQFYKKGDKVVDKYLNNSKANTTDGTSQENGFRLTFFHSTVNTVKDMMFGRLPQVTFTRSDDDPDDDAARVAASIFERMLNSDIGTNADDYSQALKDTLEDRLLPGLGVARVRYEYESETIELPEILDPSDPTGEMVLHEASQYENIMNESAPIDYVHWRDYKWSPCRRWEEKRWEAFRSYLARDELVEKFGAKLGNKIPLDANPMNDGNNDETGVESSTDAMKKAEIWEIWCKDDYDVIWYCPSHPQILKTESDPLELDNFFPTPKPLAANVTTSSFIPMADFMFAQDIYNEIDLIETRIVNLTAAVRAVGVYDSSMPELGQMINDTGEASMVAISNWAQFAEKGGLSGAVDWMPLEEVAKTAMILTERRNDLIKLLFQITGIADIMRGAQQSAGGPVSATERSLEARFASVKIQALQDEFARFATDLIRLRAEVVSKHFEPEAIIEQSNIEYTADAPSIPAAIELIKNNGSLVYRIEVKPESVAMSDFAQLKAERTEYINGLAVFMQSAAPLVAMDESVTPTLLALLKWGMAGFKGSEAIEGVLDQAIDQVTKNLQNPKKEEEKKSPEQIKQETEQAKQQFEMQKQQQAQQFEMRKMEHDRYMARLNAQLGNETLQLESDKDLNRELAQAELNIEEQTHETNEAIREARTIAGIERSTNINDLPTQ